MRILIDTHILLWAVYDQERLPGLARGLMNDPSNELLFSPASIMEIALKHSVHPEDLTVSGEKARNAFARAGFVELPITARQAAIADELPLHHRDPFDRMLLAQAKSEGIRLLSHDNRFPSYGEFVIAV